MGYQQPGSTKVAPHREVVDMELRLEAAETIKAENIKSRWMPSHQELAHAKDDQERVDIKMNNFADKLARRELHAPRAHHTKFRYMRFHGHPPPPPPLPSSKAPGHGTVGCVGVLVPKSYSCLPIVVRCSVL